MLFIVAFRNLIELSGSEFDFSGGFSLPKSFGWFRGNNVLWTISYVSPWVTQVFSHPFRDSTFIFVSHCLQFFSQKRLWIGSSTHSSPSSIISDHRYTNVTPMCCVGTWLARAPRADEAHGRYVMRKELKRLSVHMLQHSYVDQSPLVARRLGFAALPLAVLAMLIGRQSYCLFVSMHFESEGRLVPVSTEQFIMRLKWGTLGVLMWVW